MVTIMQEQEEVVLCVGKRLTSLLYFIATCEMVTIMQEHGEVVLCVGKGLTVYFIL